MKTVATLWFVAISSLTAHAAEPLPASVVDGWMETLSNWGRWGKDDELGTLNLITPATRIAAAKLVIEGRSVSMAHETITKQSVDAASPYSHEMVAHAENSPMWAVDNIAVTFHGYSHSHLDAVCHRFHKGKIYNGYASTTANSSGCGKLAVTTASDGIFTRGVLMDIARLKNKKWLEPGTPIYAEDLEAWERKAGVTVGKGDAVFIRTGRWARRAEMGPWDIEQSAAGLHVSAVKWLKDRDIAILGCDGVSDVFPSGVEGYTHPVHLLVLVALGMPMFDNLDLEAVSKVAADENRWHFLLTAAPLKIPGGTGSPLNPIATF